MFKQLCRKTHWKNKEIIALWAKCLHFSGKSTKALRILQKTLQSENELRNAAIEGCLGQILLDMRQFGDAKRYFLAQYYKKPETPKNLTFLGDCYCSQGMYSKAKQLYSLAYYSFPYNFTPKIGMMRIYAQNNQPEGINHITREMQDNIYLTIEMLDKYKEFRNLKKRFRQICKKILRRNLE